MNLILATLIWDDAKNDAPPADLNTPTEAPKKEEVVEKS